MLLKHCFLMFFVVLVLGLFIEAEAQVVEEVVYLKNGSVIRGIIVEQIPNETLRIRTRGGSEFVFQMSEVLKITKELPVVEPPSQQDQSPPVQLPPGGYIRQKDPTIAFLLSFLISGGGQFYTENYGEGAAHLIVQIVSFGLIVGALEDNDAWGRDYDGDDSIGAVGVLVLLTNWIYSMGTAPGQARAFNERQQAVSLIEDRLLLESYTSGKAQGAMLSLRF